MFLRHTGQKFPRKSVQTNSNRSASLRIEGRRENAQGSLHHQSMCKRNFVTGLAEELVTDLVGVRDNLNTLRKLKIMNVARREHIGIHTT